MQRDRQRLVGPIIIRGSMGESEGGGALHDKSPNWCWLGATLVATSQGTNSATFLYDINEMEISVVTYQAVNRDCF